MVWFFSRTSQSLDMLGILQAAGTAPLTNPLGLEPLFQRAAPEPGSQGTPLFQCKQPWEGRWETRFECYSGFWASSVCKTDGAHPNLLLAGGPVGSRMEKATGRWERGRGLEGEAGEAGVHLGLASGNREDKGEQTAHRP